MESKKELRVILLGRTGAGKTTMINVVANLILGLSYDDPRQYAISQKATLQNEESPEAKIVLNCNIANCSAMQTDLLSIGDAEVSQTKGCNIYEFENKDIKLYIADTPGVGDTSGPEQDEENKHHIISGIKKMGSFDAIILVHKASDARMDLVLQYFITEVKGMLTKDCEENFVVCFTNVINLAKIDAKKALQTLGIPLKHTCCFENDCLLEPSEIKKHLSPEDFADYYRSAEGHWKTNKNNFDKLLGIISRLHTKDSKPVVQLHNRKYVLMVILQEESRKAEHLSKKRAEVKSRKEDLLSLDKDIQSVMNYSFEEVELVTESYVDKEEQTVEAVMPNNKKNTMCNICSKVCHDGCGLEGFFGEAGHFKIQSCTAFQSKTVCLQCNHGYEYHLHTNKSRTVTFVDVTKTRVVKVPVQKVDNIKKDKHERFMANKMILESEVNKADFEIKQLDAEVESCCKKVAYLYSWINENSMHPTNEFVLDYLLYMESNAKTKYSHDREKLEMTLNGIHDFELNYKLVKQSLSEKSKATSLLSPEEQRDVDTRVDIGEKELERWAEEAKRAFYRPAPRKGKANKSYWSSLFGR